MNSTIEKFGYPSTVVAEFEHWLVLLRPAQVTLGSLVLAAKSEVTRYSNLPEASFAEQWRTIAAIEATLADFTSYERINYLMLMMVDPNVHFHVIPRYSQARIWNGAEFADAGWPGPPRLDATVNLDERQLQKLVLEIASKFRYHMTD